MRREHASLGQIEGQCLREMSVLDRVGYDAEWSDSAGLPLVASRLSLPFRALCRVNVPMVIVANRPVHSMSAV